MASKYSKKLANFFKEKEKSSKRYKAIISYVESNPPESDERKFFNEQYEGIFQVLWERLEESDEMFRKGKNLKELIQMLDILKKILTYIQQVINSRWNMEKIGTIISRCLLYNNQQPVRQAGFELLLYFIEALQNSMEEQHQTMFATAINLYPFLEKDIVLKHFPKEPPTDALLPSVPPVPPSKKDAAELLDYFLEFITNKSSNFLFWFNMFKEKYLMTFYPKIFQELRLMDKYDDTGFKNLCPPEIQAVIIDKLITWSDRPQIFGIIWDSNSNGPIMLEINRQSCLIPLSFAATIKKSMQLYRSWLMNSQKNKIFAEQVQQYWRQFIKNLSLVFTIPAKTDEIENQHQLCKEILFIYNFFAVELSSKLAKETWEVLQYTMLNSTFDLMNKSSDPMILSLLSQSSPNALQSGNSSFADHMFGALYFFWIRSQITTAEQWKEIAKKVTSLVNWKANIVQWKEKLLQLTYILRDFLYTIKETEDPESDPNKTKKDAEPFLTSTGAVIKTPVNLHRDPRLTGMNWTPETIRESWFIILHIIGNVTKISNPECHEIAMSAVREVVELLVIAEDKLPLNAEPPIPIMKYFLPWLIEACVYDETRIKGLLIAYHTVSILFCRLHLRPSKELNVFLTHYYRILHMGLNNVKSEVIWKIIEHSTHIFSYHLPGSAVLYYDFLREIEVICRPQNPSSVAIKQNALIIANSLICAPNHYFDIETPVVPAQKIESKETAMTVDQIKEKLLSLYLMVLSNVENESTVLFLAMCGATVVIIEELSHPSPRVGAVGKLINSILEYVNHPEETLSKNSTECLSSLVVFFDKLWELDKAIIVHIVTYLCDKIITLIQKDKNKHELAVSNCLYTLKDWLLGTNTDLLADRELASKVFEALEYGLLGELVEQKLASQALETASNDMRKSAKKEKKGQRDSIPRSYSAESLFQEMQKAPTHGSLIIREAAEIILLQIINQYNNFPSRGGAEVTSCTINEYDENNPILYFIYNDMMIISLVEIENNEGKTARVVVRDSMGKYVWDSKIVRKPALPPKQERPILQEDKEPSKPNPPSSPTPRSKGQLPLYSDTNLYGIDMLKEALNYLSEKHPQIFIKPSPLESSYADSVKEREKQLLEQAKKEEEAAKKQQSIQRPHLPEQVKSITSVCKFQSSRLLLTQIGFLDEENRKRLFFVEDGPKFLRNLKELDTTFGRELFKIGVIYVAHGQEDQKEILKNASGSNLYGEFVNGLGWKVDVQNHPGFLGGLDKNLSTGKNAIYYSNASQEVIFHTVTLMPSNSSDDQQIEKKRHVGNDFVHIVWSEHKREYKPTTITSQFNDAHVIIYPLPSGLFRIQIFRKEKVPYFGPLTDGMVVNKKILLLLVRQTAINATSRVRNLTKGYKKPFPTRFSLIKEIIERYKTDKSFSEYFSNFYSVKS